MDDEQYQPKISEVEIIIGFMIFGLFDLIGIVLALVGLDDFGVLDILSLPVFFYLYLKGVSPVRQAIANILEAFPGIDALPLFTIGWGFTVLLDRSQRSVLARAVTTAVAARAATNRASGKALPDPTKRTIGMRQFESTERADRTLASRNSGYSRYISTPNQAPASGGGGGAGAAPAQDKGRTLGQMTGADRGSVLETAQQRMFSPEGSLAMGQEQEEEGPVFLDGNTVDLGSEEAA